MQKSKKINLVCKARLGGYRKISEKALELAKKNISKGKEEQAKDIIKMVECYLEDSKHFEKNGHYVNSYGCLNYAHGWLDCGARLKIFNVKDNKLFAV
ncbi:MAG: DUF357 domain-containing protein [Candidatus Nanoarchaeia archaeon]|nr:DUF357 domain-containing protein [Candidatus Nanoarchaeia archaeon]MDD5741471.1 DUF357 domain-containing protein [Candidatus Nanoarchaeia archaeon]